MITRKGRRKRVLFLGTIFIVYTVASGGGLVVEKTDSLSTLNCAFEAIHLE